MKKINLIVLSWLAFSCAAFSQPDNVESIYTDLGEKYCKTTKEDFFKRSECAGVAGYKLEVTDSGDGQDLNIVFPDGSRHELDFYNYVSQAFSHFGEKAEWRVRRDGKKTEPFGLIVRFEVREEPQKIKSLLAVVKIAADSACITDIVNPAVKNQSIEARTLAGGGAQKPCLAIAQIPALIERLEDKNDFVANSAAAALVKIGSVVYTPLIEALKQKDFCDFRFMAAEIIRKIDKNHASLKPVFFDIARGLCGYRYSPEKYLPDANFGAIVAQFNAASILVTEIEGGISLLPELKTDDGAGLISSLYAFREIIPALGNKNKAGVKPETISSLKASIPMIEKAVESYEGKTQCDFYDVLRSMRESGLEELSRDANRALGKLTVNCPK